MAEIPIFNAPPEYYELWKYSIENPEGFWSEMAEKSMKSKRQSPNSSDLAIEVPTNCPDRLGYWV